MTFINGSKVKKNYQHWLKDGSKENDGSISLHQRKVSIHLKSNIVSINTKSNIVSIHLKSSIVSINLKESINL